MKRSVNRYLVVIFSMLLTSVQCSKKSDPVPTPGCSFTFKGTTYNLSISVCEDDPTNGGDINVATNQTASQLLTLTKGGSADGLVLSTNVADVSGASTYSSLNPGGSYTITISGITWTFSGTLVNSMDNSNTGSISGACTCTVTNP